MTKPLQIGMIGLDTSHAVAFTKLLNDPETPYAVPGGRVVAAFPGGSPDFELSWSRLGRFTSALRDEHGVDMLDSVEAVAERVDAVLLTSVDGRVHLEQFKRLAPFKKPVFIDKPFAVTSADARAIADLAREYGVPLMSSSSLRYAEDFVQALADDSFGELLGADVYGFAELQPTQPGLFWYGIHSAEMLYAALGRGCVRVHAFSTADHELVSGVWSDGRVGTLRGTRSGARTNGALLHRANGAAFADCGKHPKPAYAGLLERVMTMFRTGTPPIDIEETVEIVRFLEAANESRRTGQPVDL
ncbi:Gfo/Idh/MocA family protein [Paenibacillus sp.]|uniref:Gfo/Idh/MocA family protein n=1 Tax=Paenibacillus sp. TaxID=58172 RepID=UPI002D3803EE|nr:Gfo/Idh/MocA family oxidoreductase [Paenibacillus sp.]HZG58646.1 Gfo/Idh/MocA family oxidoreductase [Paenibacillus sp.]